MCRLHYHLEWVISSKLCEVSLVQFYHKLFAVVQFFEIVQTIHKIYCDFQVTHDLCNVKPDKNLQLNSTKNFNQILISPDRTSYNRQGDLVSILDTRLLGKVLGK